MANDWGTQIANELFVGNLSAGFIDVTDVIPAELNTFYTNNYGGNAIKAAIRFVSVSGTTQQYYYMILWAGTTGLRFAAGWVDVTQTVSETYSNPFSTGATVPNTILFGNVSPVAVGIGGDPGALSQLNLLIPTVSLATAVNFDTLAFAGDMLINTVSMPRGLAYAKQMTGSPVATSTAGVETIVTTLASYTYRHDRMYRFSAHGQAAESVATILTYRLRRGPGLGGQLIATWAINHPTAQGQEDAMWAYISNNTGSDLTEQVVFTIQAGGTTNATFSASGAGQGQILCEDVGASAAFLNGSSANW